MEGGCWWVTRRAGRTWGEAARCWPSQVTGVSLCSEHFIAAQLSPRKPSATPALGLGLCSAASEKRSGWLPTSRDAGLYPTLLCRPLSPQAGVKVQSVGLQPPASPRAGQFRAAVGDREREGKLCRGREPGSRAGQVLLGWPQKEGPMLAGKAGQSDHRGGLLGARLQAATPPIQAPLGFQSCGSRVLGFQTPGAGLRGSEAYLERKSPSQMHSPGNHTPHRTLLRGPASCWHRPLCGPVLWSCLPGSHLPLGPLTAGPLPHCLAPWVRGLGVLLTQAWGLIALGLSGSPCLPGASHRS